MFTSKDIQERTGLSKMQVWRMVEYGIITPTENPKGRGKVRRFSDINLAEFLIAKRLYELRAEPGQIWLALHTLREWEMTDRGIGEIKYESFWDYIKSVEYREWRGKHGDKPIFLAIMYEDPGWYAKQLSWDQDTLRKYKKAISRPRMSGIYKKDEINEILARCQAAIIVNLLPILTEAFS